MTPVKKYQRIKNEGRGELVFSSPPFDATTPTRQIAKDLIEMPSPVIIKKRNIMTDFDSPIKKKLKTLLINKSNKLHSKVAIISKMKKRNILYKTQNTLQNLVHSHKFQSINSRALVTMQLKSKTRPWTAEEKKIGFNLVL